ncbi:integral membrane protein [Aspergillus avenaceus]|uniref:Integral membrane protein n=1 Tax=Aspergillus avenaceus TaxID=36643 RepID=A0A5N6TLA5_ASPAV|nr:integral membrane protein [Aspergillus avenaceus]
MNPSSFTQRDQNKSHYLKPILRAYALGYLSSTTPKIISSLQRIRKSDLDYQQKCKVLLHALTSTIRLDGFPTSCATLVGGSTIFPVVILRCYELVRHRLGSRTGLHESAIGLRLVRFVCAFFSARLSFELLNRRPIRLQAAKESHQDIGNGDARGLHESKLGPRPRPQFAGRTLDLTLFGVTRAVDLVACILWARWKRQGRFRNRWSLVERTAPKLADAGVFASSAAIVMWAWFYLPERLPRSYERWIGEAAKVDTRLIEALRRARRNIFVYGKDTGQAPLLESMCKDYGWPIEWGDPSKTIPIPCEMVHMGCGPNCERHAVSRFFRTFMYACATYIPLQIAFRLRSMRSASSLRRSLSSALRSSAFLASFVSTFYYSVCLARTRIGPKIFSKEAVTPMMWDSGLCVGAGCLMCGWSILVESPSKRRELALFVAPRAVATVLPRFYARKYQYRESIAFALSAALLLTCLQEQPQMVRGVFGRIATSVLK